MFLRKNTATTFVVLAILFLNLLFVLKYSYIYLMSPYFFTVVYFISFVATIFLLDLTKEKIHQKALAIIAVTVVGLAFVYVLTVHRIGEINRLTAIQDWWRLFEKGIFPYNSKLTPSSFPGLFLIAYPFYKLNLLGLLEPLGIGIFLFLLFQFNRGKEEKIYGLFLFLSAPIIYYSLVVRCELFFNTSLFLLDFYLMLKFVKPEKVDFNFILFSALSGFLLSTRSVFVIPLIIFSLYYLRNNLKNLFLFGAVAGAVFLLLLFPFYLWDKAAFLQNGPFAIQSKLSALPFWIVFLFIVASLYAGWAVKNIKEVFLVSGLFLLFLPLLSYLLKIFDFGFKTAFFNDKIDLSYLAFAFPFLILSLSLNERRHP